ncbi:MAG: hypothetical protein ACYTFG_18920 [Planctomycetota bacterium]|jgi:hypothetical protein
MTESGNRKCEGCGYENPLSAMNCSLCGKLFGSPRAEGADEPLVVPEGGPSRYGVRRETPEQVENSPPVVIGPVSIPRPLFHMALGIPLALIFNWLMCGFMGFATGLLFHETGHAFAAIFFGHPAIPNARGFCSWYSQSFFLAAGVWIGLAVLAWKVRDRKPLLVLLGVTLLVQPILAFMKFHMVVMSLAGHGGEAVFAAIFLWRALRGGFFKEFERPLYAMLGWYLWLSNVFMCLKLMTDDVYRRLYVDEPSLAGGANDYVVVAGSLGWRLESVALLMLLFVFLAPASSVAAWLLFSRKG